MSVTLDHMTPNTRAFSEIRKFPKKNNGGEVSDTKNKIHMTNNQTMIQYQVDPL